MKLHTTDQPGFLTFKCPACGNCHGVWTQPRADGKPVWGWNGSMDRPTFTPSIKVMSHTWVPPVTPENHEEWKRAPWEQHKVDTVCHSFVRDGFIEYCSDCTHTMAGKTVELPEW